MDKKTSISTVILVLLVLLSVVSLASSAYLFFTFNPLNTKTEEKIVEKDEYEGWNTYTSENLYVTIKYPSNWIIEDHKATEDQNYDALRVSTLPGENFTYPNAVFVRKLKEATPGSNLSDLVEGLVEENLDSMNTLTCDSTKPITKWEVQTYKCSLTSEDGEETIYYFILRGSIYSISYTVADPIESENQEKVLNSIVLYPY